jgi:hypothetical protein
VRYELYDLSDDPTESRNLYSDQKGLGFLRARLDRYEEFRSQRRGEIGTVEEKKPAAAAPVASEPNRKQPSALGEPR